MTPSAPRCIISAASAGVATPPAAKLTTGSLPDIREPATADHTIRRATSLRDTVRVHICASCHSCTWAANPAISLQKVPPTPSKVTLGADLTPEL